MREREREKRESRERERERGKAKEKAKEKERLGHRGEGREAEEARPRCAVPAHLPRAHLPQLIHVILTLV